MNREFHVSQYRGLVAIISAIAGLALLLVILQLAGGLNPTEVQGFNQVQSQSQTIDVVALAEPASAQSAYALQRGWKAEEIGAEAASNRETLRPAEIEDALSLGSYFKVGPYAKDFETTETMHSKVETMLAAEAREAGHPVQTEGCQP